MKAHRLCLVFATLFSLHMPAVFAADEPPKTPPPVPAATTVSGAKIYQPKDLNALREVKGQEVVVEGVIAQTGENKSKTIRYLNFSKSYSDAVSLVFFVSKGGEAFALEKLTPWIGKKVRATGKVSDYQDKMQIVIEKMEQIQEVKEPAPEVAK